MIERESYRSVDWWEWPVKKPYPWERNVTVCIAAPCRDFTDSSGSGRRLVLCTDGRRTSIVGTGDTSLKIHILTPEWKCLASGPESEILSLVRIAQRQFKLPNATTAENIDATVKSVAAKRKAQKADEITNSKWGIPYDEFLKHGKERLSAQGFRDTEIEIERFSTRTELIFAGFINGETEVYKVEYNGRSYPVEEFAVIGEGETLASGSLYDRGQHYMRSLESTLYAVYEAKCWAAAVPSVGPTTMLTVVFPDGIFNIASNEQIAFFKTKYDDCKRRPMPVLDVSESLLVAIKAHPSEK
jgi:20S proteasome alpha/beta subunit